MKKRKLRNLAEISIIAIALLLAFTSCAFAFDRQLTPNEVRVKNFYKEEKDSLDMVVIGSSSVYTSFSSPLAWKEYGFTSYVLATSGAPMGIMKSMLIETMKTQKPKLIVVDMNGVMYNDNLETKEGSLRLWIDNMPYSQNKIDTINYLVPKDQRDSYINPVLKYHNNWEKLGYCIKMSILETRYFFDRNNLSVSGMSGTAKKANRKNIIDITNYHETQPLFNESGKHLYDLLDYLKENEIKNVVFVNTPRYYEKRMLAQRRALTQASKVISQYGYKVYDLDYDLEKIGLDVHEDFYDHNHVNIYGQQKVTRYLASLFDKEYHLSGDHHSDKTKEKWNIEYKTYSRIFKWVENKIQNNENIKYDIRKFEDIIFSDGEE